jgi:hypothetical protein
VYAELGANSRGLKFLHDQFLHGSVKSSVISLACATQRKRSERSQGIRVLVSTITLGLKLNLYVTDVVKSGAKDFKMTTVLEPRTSPKTPTKPLSSISGA